MQLDDLNSQGGTFEGQSVSLDRMKAQVIRQKLVNSETSKSMTINRIIMPRTLNSNALKQMDGVSHSSA